MKFSTYSDNKIITQNNISFVYIKTNFSKLEKIEAKNLKSNKSIFENIKSRVAKNSKIYKI